MEALEVVAVGASACDAAGRAGEGAQPEETRAALCGALRSEVSHDAGGLANPAGGGGQKAHHSAPQSETTFLQCGAVERQLHGARCIDPCAEIAAEQHGSQSLRRAASDREDLAHGRTGFDLDHSRLRDCARDRDEDGANSTAPACRAEPVRAVPRDEPDLGKGFDVLHEYWWTAI